MSCSINAVIPGSCLYLDSNLRQVDLRCQFLPAVDVWIVGLLEGSLQLMKLIGGEGGTVSSVLFLAVLFLFDGLRRAVSDVHFLGEIAHFFTLITREKTGV